MNKFTLTFALLFLLLSSCGGSDDLMKYGKHYQKYRDYESLNNVVNLVKQNADKAYLKKILGEPVDMGFDYRYLIDSSGENGCPVGAVFHFSDDELVSSLWIGEICE